MKNFSLGFKYTTVKTLQKIRRTVNAKNYKLLQLHCYVCDAKEHIAIDCPEFNTIEGNIRNYFEKRRIESHVSDGDEEGGATKGRKPSKADIEIEEEGEKKKGQKTIAVTPMDNDETKRHFDSER